MTVPVGYWGGVWFCSIFCTDGMDRLWKRSW